MFQPNFLTLLFYLMTKGLQADPLILVPLCFRLFRRCVIHWSPGAQSIFTDPVSSEGASIFSNRPQPYGLAGRLSVWLFLWGRKCLHYVTVLWCISKLGNARGALYWVLVKLMCQARLEPERMFGSYPWPSEINRKLDSSSSNSFVHVMCLTVSLLLHVGIKPCHIRSCCSSRLLKTFFRIQIITTQNQCTEHLFAGRTTSSISMTSAINSVIDYCIIRLVDC